MSVTLPIVLFSKISVNYHIIKQFAAMLKRSEKKATIQWIIFAKEAKSAVESVLYRKTMLDLPREYLLSWDTFDRLALALANIELLSQRTAP